jgi:hypothetical protein
MAYDAATGNVVLFGGLSRFNHMLGDTWVWDGTTWTQQAPAASPSARDFAPMVYDTATGNVVLFGGDISTCGVLGDTWVWGSNSSTKKPGPSPGY